MVTALLIIGWVLSIILAMWVQSWIERTRGADYERAAVISGRYQAALEAGYIEQRERRERMLERRKGNS